MSDLSWKAFERRVAKRVGGKRIPVTGERDGADVVAGPFVYQAKLRRGMPSYLREWLRGITAAGERSGTTGVVVWKAPGARDDDAVVVLRLKDWQALRIQHVEAKAVQKHLAVDRREVSKVILTGPKCQRPDSLTTRSGLWTLDATC